MLILKLLKFDFLNWGSFWIFFCFNRMSYICEYVSKPFEKSEKVKIACWQPALMSSFKPKIHFEDLFPDIWSRPDPSDWAASQELNILTVLPNHHHWDWLTQFSNQPLQIHGVIWSVQKLGERSKKTIEPDHQSKRIGWHYYDTCFCFVLCEYISWNTIFFNCCFTS